MVGTGWRYCRQVLHGREPERAHLAGLVEQARAGTGAVVVLLGEPGVGKSALLRDLTAQTEGSASTVKVLRTAGVEAESPLPYAALYRLLRPVANFGQLPGPQARALRVAFGLEEGPAVEPFLVGVATLSVLTDAAVPDRPLLVVVDDAHWLDLASAGESPAEVWAFARADVERAEEIPSRPGRLVRLCKPAILQCGSEEENERR